MSNEPKQAKIEPLELNKETLAELTDQEAEDVKGGMVPSGRGVCFSHKQTDCCLSHEIDC